MILPAYGCWRVGGGEITAVTRKDETMGFFKKLFGSSASSARDCYERGLARERKADHLQAVADFTEAIRLRADYADAYYARGLVHEVLGYYDQALRDFERVMRLEPDDIDHIAVEVGDTPELNRVTRMDSAASESLGWEVLQQGVQMDIARVSAGRGMALVDEGNFNQAIEDFSRALKLDPNSGIYFERGRAYCESGQFDKAALDLLKAAQSNPEDKEYRFHIYLLLGKSLYQLENYDKAIFNLGIALRLKTDVAEAYALRGGAYFNKHECARAIADFSEALRLEPSFGAYVGRAGAYLETKQYAPAIADLNELIRLAPEDPGAYQTRAQAYRALGDNAKAEQDEQRAQAAVYLAQAFQEMQQQNWDQAIWVLSETIRLDPRQFRAYLRRGMAYLARQEPDQAIADFNHLLKSLTMPEATAGPHRGVYIDSFVNRGNALCLKGDFRRAIADYTEALRLEPHLAPAYEDRARAFRAVGDIEHAMKDERKARQLRG